jgi:hypothetical protein
VSYNLVTFKDLRKRVSLEEETIQQQSKLFERLRNKPFWICDIQKHKQEDIRTKGDCCFNHIIGLPKKDEVEKPIFDYEMQLLNALDNHKSVFVKKARGLGITEILLRYMAWLAVFDDTYHNCRFHIVTGPRINLAEELIDIIRLLFQNAKTPIMLKQIGPIIYFNNVTIQAFPSHTVSTMRGYTDVKFIFID